MTCVLFIKDRVPFGLVRLGCVRAADAVAQEFCAFLARTQSDGSAVLAAGDNDEFYEHNIALREQGVAFLKEHALGIQQRMALGSS